MQTKKNSNNTKSAQRRRKHYALAVVRPIQKISPRHDPLLEGVGVVGRPKFNQLDMVTTSPTNPVWWGSMHAISSYRGNRPTNKHTHKQTGPITIHCAAASAQCKKF